MKKSALVFSFVAAMMFMGRTVMADPAVTILQDMKYKGDDGTKYEMVVGEVTQDKVKLAAIDITNVEKDGTKTHSTAVFGKQAWTRFITSYEGSKSKLHKEEGKASKDSDWKPLYTFEESKAVPEAKRVKLVMYISGKGDNAQLALELENPGVKAQEGAWYSINDDDVDKLDKTFQKISLWL